uniref:Cystatin domain-containing protein n=1 Tax=Panagrellus redivivus TaxID=6233 RepID=A0A7E4ZQE5_PANRE
MKHALIAVLIVCLGLFAQTCARNPGNMAKTSVHDPDIINATNYALKKWQEEKHSSIVSCDISDAYSAYFFSERLSIDTLIKYIPCDKKLKGDARVCPIVTPTVLSLNINYQLTHGSEEPKITFTKF